jgi:hypothetical protein
MTVTVLPVAAIQNNEKQESLTGLAPISNNPNIESIEKQNKQIEMMDRSTPFYGYNTYDPTSVLPEGPIEFDPATPGIITSLGPTSSGSFISGATWADGLMWNGWFGCEYGTGEIWQINEFGIMTYIGGGGVSLNGLAYDPVTDVMYGCSSYDLYTISTSGVQTKVGPFNTGGIMIGIAFDCAANLYGVDIITDTLYYINTITGAVVAAPNPLGMDILYAQDMAFDIDNNELYLSAYVVDPLPDGGYLYTCDTNTGVASLVGPFQGLAEITGFAIKYSSVKLEIIASSITGGLLSTGQPKLQFDVINHGCLTATNVNWNINIGPPIIGFAIQGASPSPNPIPTIGQGATYTITSGTIFGFGILTATITVDEPLFGSTDTKTKMIVIIGLLM